METKGVALGYVGDKIRYIRLIRVRLTTEFFFEHGFIGLTRMLRSVSEYHHLIKSAFYVKFLIFFLF